MGKTIENPSVIALQQLPSTELAHLFATTFPNPYKTRQQDITLTSVQSIKDGFNSRGFRATLQTSTEQQNIFIKQPKLRNGELASQVRDVFIETGKQLPNIPITHAIIGQFDNEFALLEPDMSIHGLTALLIIQELVDTTEYIPLVDAMKQLGAQTIQTDKKERNLSWVTPQWTENLYTNIVAEMAHIHAIPTEPAELDYRRGIEHVMTSHERFKGVASFMLNREDITSFLSPFRITQLRNSMWQLIDMYTESGTKRATTIHGDQWMANRLVNEQGLSRLIDPAPIKVSDAAYDVTFSLTDLAMLQMHKNADVSFSGKFTTMAERMLSQYEELANDPNIRHYMALFYAYKAFVGAAFDATTEPQRQNLYYSGIGAANLGKSPQFKFSFSDLDAYIEHGKQFDSHS